jgi:site-specific DNA recombinase
MNAEINTLSRAVLYVRVSTEEQISGTSLDSQRTIGEHIALANGFEVERVCEDPGVSGVRYTTRPGIMEALEVIEAGEATALIATKLDRLGRDARVILEIVERVKRAGGKVITSDFRFDDSIMGRFLTTIFAAIAQLDRDNIVERNTTGLRARAVAGMQPNISTPAYGYDIYTKKDLLAGRCRPDQVGIYRINPATSTNVRRIFDWYTQGWAVADICRELERRRIKSATGLRNWNVSTVHRMLKNEAYIGKAHYGTRMQIASETTNKHLRKMHIRTVWKPKTVWITIPCPRIISDEIWDRVRSRKASMPKQKPKDTCNTYVFRSIIRCPSCHKGLYGLTRQGIVSYACIDSCFLTVKKHPTSGRIRPIRFLTQERIMAELVTLLADRDSIMEPERRDGQIRGEEELFFVRHGLYMLNLALTSPFLTVKERRFQLMDVVQSIVRSDDEYILEFWPVNSLEMSSVIRVPIPPSEPVEISNLCQ